MQPFPHRYVTTASGGPEGDIVLGADQLSSLTSASPVEFDGPGDRWSPETLLTAAVADCLVLSFRAVARASRLSWVALHCTATGTLERLEGVTRFSAFAIEARLRVPTTTDTARARQALEKAERMCLIANSLKAPVHLTVTVDVERADPSEAPSEAA